MHAMDKPTSLIVELRPSHHLAWLLGAVHGGALLVLGYMPLPWWLVVIATAAVITSAVLSIGQHALLLGPRAVKALQFSDRESLQLRTGDGQWHGGCLLGSSTVWTVLTVLNIRLNDGGAKHVVITGKGIDNNQFRRLRVWLRWGPNPAGDDGASA